MKPIHPFPARMAPEIAADVINSMGTHRRLLDPMCGSGTVLRRGVEAGLDCVGYDTDPLSVLLASAWTSRVPGYRLLHDANLVVERADALRPSDVTLPWDDAATHAFAQYWFGHSQFDSLARISTVLRHTRLRTRELLAVCMSRTIITKDRGASLARDVSHSRPHRVMANSDFDVYAAFIRAARHVAVALEPERIRGEARIAIGDVRELHERPGWFDMAVTSPPYLNAIDYLRGHRLSLIWMGYPLRELSEVRSQQVGAERAAPRGPVDVRGFVSASTGPGLSDRHMGWLRRYASDMLKVMENLRRVVRRGGSIVIVVGNSAIRGVTVDNAGIVEECATRVHLTLCAREDREIPARRRYLPPPRPGSALGQRMRKETVLVFERG